MKHLAILSIFTLHFSLFTLFASAAVPLKWTVETSRAVPAQFEAYQGETLDLEAALQSYGKPLEAPANYSLYWQTNGMGNAWWSTNCTTNYQLPSTNLLRATWTPSMETGAKVYNCFIGQPGTIYHAAFQLRLRPSPGAVPNTLPLPVPVIDFAKVHVLNPPWGSGGVDTNAVRDIVREQLATNGIRSVDGAARPLPRYLHAIDFDDSYPAEAEAYYRERGSGLPTASCSAVRDGNTLSRNFDWTFDDAAEFVVRVSSGLQAPSTLHPAPTRRFASVGVAQVGTNLTEQIVTSGRPSRYYKWLPGATVDGINENGVVAAINVVGGRPVWRSNPIPDAVHPLGAVRWVLDNATNAQSAAQYLANKIRFPSGWTQNYHYMIADETSTYIVENAAAAPSTMVPGPRAVLTNFRWYPRDPTGEGQERYDALMSGANITSQWWTATYTPSGYRASDLPGITGESLTNLFAYWASKPREAHRGETFPSSLFPNPSSLTWWQTVHTSIYDLTNRTLRVAVQETDDWYSFAVPGGGGVSPAQVREIAGEVVKPVASAVSTLSSSVSGLQSSKRDLYDFEVRARVKPEFLPISGGSYDWSSHSLERTTSNYNLYDANGRHAFQFSLEGERSTGDRILFNGIGAFDYPRGTVFLDLEDRIALRSELNRWVDTATGVEYEARFHDGQLYYVPTGRVYPPNN